MPRVTVIIPNYNHGSYLKQRIQSILDQTFQDFEILILDDASTDNSNEIIEQYKGNSKVRNVIYNELNSGSAYKQWSKGMDYAEGELIWIAESDDWCHEKFLENLIPFFDNEDVVLGFTHSKFILGDEIINDTGSSLQPEISVGINFIREIMLTRNYILNASMVVFRKDAYSKVKDKSWKYLKLAGDWMLWLNILQFGKTVEVFKELNYCRRHENNTTNKYRKLGFDFLEGVQVLKIGKRLCNFRYSRKSVFLSWVNLYKVCRSNFIPGVKLKVLSCLAWNEPLFFFYYFYDIMRNFYHNSKRFLL
jgi:glycosyltransferase involved in cell wall biosynthesis